VTESGIERRRLIQLTGAALGAAALGTSCASSEQRPADLSDKGVSAYPFPLGTVALLPGPFKDNMTRTTNYLEFVDPDRLLYTFRTNVGIATTAQPCGGWEAPDVEVRGHNTGHLMTALAQAYANTGKPALKAKGDYLVASLAECQAAGPRRGFHPGYLSAFPESFFDRLETGNPVWAPYYIIHKLMAGLLDQHQLAGNAQAMPVLTALAGWVKTRTARLGYAQMQAVLTATEPGGMAEILARYYQVTGDAGALAAARRFEHAMILDPLADGRDELAGLHANTQVPKVIGALREYNATGTPRYRTIAANFWDIITGHHMYEIGGFSNAEHFRPPGQIANQLSDTTCECCVTYHVLKLTRSLFFTDPARADYMDYYERALFNQILGQQDPASQHGFVAYYIPTRAGGRKTYSNDYEDFRCDHATGMESNTKYMDSIYFYAGDTLYVNLFIASVLTWPGRGITVRQDTAFPALSTSRLTITGSGRIALKLRIPYWSEGATVQLNGTELGLAATPGSYVTIDRVWHSGDQIDLTLPARLTFAPTPDDPSVQVVKYGGIVLAGQYGGDRPAGTLPTLNAATIEQDPDNPLHFTGLTDAGPVSLLPFYQSQHQDYSVYWKVTGSPDA
jgi:DUF1680 family protein